MEPISEIILVSSLSLSVIVLTLFHVGVRIFKTWENTK